jgi:hypothetical protein
MDIAIALTLLWGIAESFDEADTCYTKTFQ